MHFYLRQIVVVTHLKLPNSTPSRASEERVGHPEPIRGDWKWVIEPADRKMLVPNHGYEKVQQFFIPPARGRIIPTLDAASTLMKSAAFGCECDGETVHYVMKW